MDIRAEEISKIIRDQIGSYAVQVDVAEVGSVISLGDGIARVHGVERAMAGGRECSTREAAPDGETLNSARTGLLRKISGSWRVNGTPIACSRSAR